MDRTRQAVDKIGFPAVTSQLEGREGEEKYMWDLDRLTIWAIIWVVTSFSIPRHPHFQFYWDWSADSLI